MYLTGSYSLVYTIRFVPPSISFKVKDQGT